MMIFSPMRLIVCCVLFAQVLDLRAVESTRTNTIQINWAYRSAALTSMAQEASWFARQLKLPISLPIHAEDIEQSYYISPPKMGFGGVFKTTNYLFRFSTRLDEIVNREKHDGRFDLYPIWAKTPSLIDTNGAYQLATQWLATISIDVPALQKKYPLSFYQWFYWGREAGVPDVEWNQHPPTTNMVMMPIYDVYWGEKGSPAAKITVFGPTKELLVFEMYDISVSKRPPIVISNWQELLNVPDPPKKQLTPSSGKATQ